MALSSNAISAFANKFIALEGDNDPGSHHTMHCINVCIPKERTTMGNNRGAKYSCQHSNVPTFVQKM